MPTHHVHTRTAWADPLSHHRDVDVADPTTLSVADAAGEPDGPDDWLEVAVIPADAIVWVIRDGELVSPPTDRASA